MHGACGETWWCPSVGLMSAPGVGEMHFIDGIMNSQMYCSVLKEKFSNMTIIQKHTSKATIASL
ncbi:unnamed protein product, partial [Staurois parvus]